MAYRLQFRKDTLEEWNKWNPQLADGEIGYIRGTNLYKLGEPWTQEEINKLPEEGRPAVGSMKFWKDLPTFGFNGNFSTTLEDDGGDPANEAVSKQVLKNKFEDIEEAISKLSSKDELLTLSTRIDDIDTAISEINNNIIAINGSIDSINDNIVVVNNTLENKSDKATTLEGYGITDAYTKEEVDSKYQVISQSEYQQLVNNDQIDTEVFYYTYEE